MVDSIWGNSAGISSRLGLQSSIGRDPVDGKAVEGKSAPARNEPLRDIGPGEADPQATGLVSAGRASVRSMAAEPPVDSARVAELKEAIASGRYKVDPDRIAEAMLRSEPGLFRS